MLKSLSSFVLCVAIAVLGTGVANGEVGRHLAGRKPTAMLPELRHCLFLVQPE